MWNQKLLFLKFVVKARDKVKVRVRKVKKSNWYKFGEQHDCNNRVFWNKIRRMREQEKRNQESKKQSTPISDHNNRNITISRIELERRLKYIQLGKSCRLDGINL